MSDDGRDRFEIPKEMRSMAEASFDQARKTFEKFVASAQATAGTIEERGATVRAGAKDISGKAISYAEKNVQASLDYAQSLLKAKDLTEVMRLHSEYVQAPDAFAGRAGQRNGPDRQPRRDGCGEAENLRRLEPDRSLAPGCILQPAGLPEQPMHPVRVTYVALHHKFALRCTKLT